MSFAVVRIYLYVVTETAVAFALMNPITMTEILELHKNYWYALGAADEDTTDWFKNAARHASYISQHAPDRIVSLLHKKISKSNCERCGKGELLLCSSRRGI